MTTDIQAPATPAPSPETMLAIVTEIALTVGHPDAAIESARVRLEQVFDAATDEVSRALVNQTWDAIQQMSQQTQQGIRIAAAARELAAAHAAETRAAITAHEDLLDAIKSLDTDNDHVNDLWDAAKDFAWETVMDKDLPTMLAEGIYEQLGLPASYTDIESFVKLLYSEEHDNALTDVLRSRLGGFITAFMADYREAEALAAEPADDGPADPTDDFAD